jgi:hypothetical protein
LKKAILAFVAVIFGFTMIQCQGHEKSLIWTISGKELNESSYIFATFHLLCQEKDIADARVKDELKSFKVLAPELDFDDPDLMRSMSVGMLFEIGTKAGEYPNDEGLKPLNDFFVERMKIPSDAFKNLSGNENASWVKSQCTRRSSDKQVE